MKKRFSLVKKWITSHPKTSLIVTGILLVIIAAATAWGAYVLTRPAPIDTTPIKVAKREPVVYYSPLTGLKVKNQAATKAPVTAIMIENSPSARPQSGLKQAGVVYEAIAEGGITRFMALYQQDKPSLIGPVRSLRIYFVDWLAPYQASVAHVGGSKAALDEIRNGTYRDLDQFFNAGTYWRSSDRYAPHNVYTNFKKLDALNRQKGFKASTFKSFARVDGQPAKKATAPKVHIDFSTALYNTDYVYNKKTNTYTRFMGGEPHVDREKGKITPSVIVALKVNERRVMQDGYRQDIDTAGSGVAYIFQNGSVQKATWKKAGRAKPLRLVDKNGKDIPLVRGQTWIAAVPNGKGSISW